VDIRQLKFAIAAAGHGSFRRAACALETDSSTVSRRVSDLEHEIGVPLFVRMSSGTASSEENLC
jgi:DNA-binding transcriptional LysR family regulator